MPSAPVARRVPEAQKAGLLGSVDAWSSQAGPNGANKAKPPAQVTQGDQVEQLGALQRRYLT